MLAYILLFCKKYVDSQDSQHVLNTTVPSLLAHHYHALPASNHTLWYFNNNMLHKYILDAYCKLDS